MLVAIKETESRVLAPRILHSGLAIKCALRRVVENVAVVVPLPHTTEDGDFFGR